MKDLKTYNKYINVYKHHNAYGSLWYLKEPYMILMFILQAMFIIHNKKVMIVLHIVQALGFCLSKLLTLGHIRRIYLYNKQVLGLTQHIANHPVHMYPNHYSLIIWFASYSLHHFLPIHTYFIDHSR